MLKRGMKDNKHTLTDQDFDEFAKRTENFSGSDIAILVRDAVYEPVRRLQTATKFKQVDGKYVPCRPGEDGEPGNWMSFPKDKVDIGLITREDFDSALKRTKPSVDQTQLKEYEEFTQTFGQDG
jgi:vacuolar protein-sorting-associated protein 4